MERTKKGVDNKNELSMSTGSIRINFRFSMNCFWNNIGCMVYDTTFGVGGSRRCDNEEEINISGSKRKKRNIWGR